MNIVKGRVVQNGRLELEVSDAEGAVRFPVPEPLVGPAGRHLGGELFLGLRPETITRRGTQRPGTNVFAFERAIDVVEPTGPDTMLVFTLGGIEAIGRVHPEDKAPADTLFPFEVNMDRAKLFDPASGKRCADHGAPRAIVADIGGTNARFAIADLDTLTLTHFAAFPCAPFSSPAAMIAAYSRRLPSVRPARLRRRRARCGRWRASDQPRLDDHPRRHPGGDRSQGRPAAQRLRGARPLAAPARRP
jgi:hypothetical protein